MGEFLNKKRSSVNGAAILKGDSLNITDSEDEIDGALCGKRRSSETVALLEEKAFEGDIPGNLDVGRLVKIEGSVPFGVERFQINLCCEHSDSVIALHISARFKNRSVVRNTFLDGSWETEQKDGPFPFASGKDFCVLILVQADSYHIAVNGQHCWVFAHRLPYESVTTLNVLGPVKVSNVEFPSVEKKDQQEASDSFVPSLQPVINPSVPFSYTIRGGLKAGMKICISGRTFVSVYRFAINLQCGSGPYPPPDVAFHFDVRAYNHSVVRNTRRNNNWEHEEVTAPCNVFQPGKPFDLVISVESDKYVVTVNDNYFIEYNHRITLLSSIDTLRIENDVVVASVNFQ